MLCCADVHGLLLLWFLAFNSWIKITFPEWSWETSYKCRTMQLVSECVTLSIRSWHLTKESQIQNSGTAVSPYNDVVCRWLWKPLAARWEFQHNGGHIEIALTATRCCLLHAEGTCWIMYKREVWTLTLNMKLNSNALAAPGDCQKCENQVVSSFATKLCCSTLSENLVDHFLRQITCFLMWERNVVR